MAWRQLEQQIHSLERDRQLQLGRGKLEQLPWRLEQ